MAAPALKQHSEKRITVEEYLRLEEAAETKHEYVGGDVIAMAGATREHNEIVANLIRELGNCLKGKECAIYPSDFRVTTPAGKSYFYPDATVVCGNLQMQPNVFDTLQNPVVIFEVMSEGTENIDRGYKFFHYQQIPSLLEYILIDSRKYFVEAIRRQDNDTWRFEKLSSADGKLELNSIGCTLSFDDIYYRVQFPSAT
jgi:Uma2 family endonuclease